MKLPHYATHLNPIFLWVLLSIACYRLQRIITSDSWYPFMKWRVFLAKHAQPAARENRHNLWTESAELFRCPFCIGTWLTLAVFWIDCHVISIPLPALQAVAAAGVVGFVGGVLDSDE